jgi:PPOX class probable F420-dependent enzyme
MTAPTNNAMGHGVKQRDKVKMSPDEVRDFLSGRRSMTMCTLGPDGSIHAIAMWYGFLGDDIVLESKSKAQKVLNLRRDPRITVLVEAGEYYEELHGVSISGRAEIVEDKDRVWQIGASVIGRYSPPMPDDATRDFAIEALIRNRVGIRVIPERTVTWDHRKLGLPSTRPPA